jgi:hemolysin activation/secretion protein
MDAGYGKGHNELESSWAHVANLGIGWDVRMGRHLLSSLSWAVPVTAKGTGDLDDEGSQLFWSLRYAY